MAFIDLLNGKFGYFISKDPHQRGEKKNSVLFSHKFKISAFQKLMCSGSDNTAAFLKWSVIEIYKD